MFLDIFASEKRINHGGENHRLDIIVDFHVYEFEKAIKLAKNWNNEDCLK